MHAIFYLTWLAVTLILLLLFHGIKTRCLLGRWRRPPLDAAGRTARPLPLPQPGEPGAAVGWKDALP